MKVDEKVTQTEAMILASHLFRPKPQMKRLLKYLIRHTYSNNTHALQQRSIAIECLGRGDDFDSAKDPIVRIEAARLRKLLDHYYEQENFTPPPYRISLPKGSYQLSFSRNLENKLSEGFGLLLLCQSPRFASDKALGLMLKIRRDLSIRLSEFRHTKLTVDFSAEGQVAERGAIHFLAEEQHDYVLRMEVVENSRDGSYLLSTIAVHRATQEILWSQSSQLSEHYGARELNSFYKRLIGPLIADAYGLLGKHWAKNHLANDIEYVPDHHIAYVYYIALCNEPNLELAKRLLGFLEERLERRPEDFVAKTCYLSLGFFDFFLNYQLIKDDYAARLSHALEMTKYYPRDSGISILVGFCYFLVGDYDQSKVYLELGRDISSDNSLWDFIIGTLLFFMGESAHGVAILQEIRTNNPLVPGYYYIPECFYALERGEAKRAYQAGSRVFFAGDLEVVVKAMAYQGVGASQQAKREVGRLRHTKDDGGASWLQSRVLSNHPELRARVATMLKDLRA